MIWKLVKKFLVSLQPHLKTEEKPEGEYGKDENPVYTTRDNTVSDRKSYGHNWPLSPAGNPGEKQGDPDVYAAFWKYQRTTEPIA